MNTRVAALDTVRGILLILMTLDHLGGPIAKHLYGRFGFVSAAEGFFFLSGFVAFKVALRKESPYRWFLLRAQKIWTWHGISLLTVCILVVVLASFGWKTLPGTENLAQHPFSFCLSSLSLLHLPDYLDVLPLYVLLMLCAAWLFPLVRQQGNPSIYLLLLSFAVWGFAQFEIWTLVRALLPAWMQGGVFDPLAWQLVFFSGGALALHARSEKAWWYSPRWLLIAAVAGITLFAWKNGWITPYVPSESGVLNSRTHLGILRVLNFSALLLILGALMQKFPGMSTWTFPALLGRHSLYVFSFHLPLVYLWLYRPFRVPPPLEILIPIALVFCLALPAFLREKS